MHLWVLVLELLLAALVVLLSIKILRNRGKKDNYEKIPGPPGLPIIGNTLEAIRNMDRILDWYIELGEKYGKTFKLRTLSTDIVVVLEPECVHHFLSKNFTNYIKSPLYQDVFYDFLGEGIFNVNAEKWYQQRQTAKSMFTIHNLDNLIPTFQRHTDKLMSVLKHHADSGKPFDIQDLFMRFTLDSIGDVGFGDDLKCLEEEDSRIAEAFDYVQAETEWRYWIHPLWKWLPKTKFNNSMKLINDLVYGIIENRRHDPDIASRQDILSKFMCVRDDEGKPFPDKYLRDVVVNFLVAGRDTTAVLLTWTFWVLTQNPEIQKKVVEELRSIDELTPSTIRKLTYTKCVLNETLRLYTPIPADGKTAVSDDVLPNGWTMRAGVDIGYSAYVMHRNPEYWDEPLKFKPERWLATANENNPNPDAPVASATPVPVEGLKYHPYQYIPFYAGPRVCLGQNMAQMEAKIILFNVLRNFEMKPMPNQDVKYKVALTMPARDGIKVTIHPRK